MFKEPLESKEMDTIKFTIPLPPLLNQFMRMHWTTRNTLNDRIKQDVGWLIRAQLTAAVQSWGKVHVTFHIRSKRRMDVDNRVNIVKMVMDGIKESGLIPDDSPDFCSYTFPTWEKKEEGESEVIVEITREEAVKEGGA